MALSNEAKTQLLHSLGLPEVVDEITRNFENKQLEYYDVSYNDLNDAGSGNVVLFGKSIPNKAIITRVFIDITNTFHADGDESSEIKIGIEDQDNDVLEATAISTLSASGIYGTPIDNTTSNFFKLSAARQLAMTCTIAGTDTVLTAGQMRIFVEWVQGA